MKFKQKFFSMNFDKFVSQLHFRLVFVHLDQIYKTMSICQDYCELMRNLEMNRISFHLFYGSLKFICLFLFLNYELKIYSLFSRMLLFELLLLSILFVINRIAWFFLLAI